VAGSCEHGNEPSGSIKFGEFLDYLSLLLASQEGLCSMELVSCSVMDGNSMQRDHFEDKGTDSNIVLR
jgi:hypothetical protein